MFSSVAPLGPGVNYFRFHEIIFREIISRFREILIRFREIISLFREILSRLREIISLSRNNISLSRNSISLSRNSISLSRNNISFNVWWLSVHKVYVVRWSRSDLHTAYVETVLCMAYLW